MRNTSIPEPDFAAVVAGELGLETPRVRQALQLLNDGNTIPFIARYRKEMTKELDENQLRDIEEKYHGIEALYVRKTDVLRLLYEHGAMDDENMAAKLTRSVTNASTLTEVEDIYRPYRPKRQTRAAKAKARGLEPLLTWLKSASNMMRSKDEARTYAEQFVTQEVESSETALEGAADIFAEQVADDAATRKWLRNESMKQGRLRSVATDAKANSVYEMYYDFSEPLQHVMPHRVLAINRGEREDYLKVSVDVQESIVMDYFTARHIKPLLQGANLTRVLRQDNVASLLKEAVIDAYKRLLAPAIAREIRSELTERAEHHALFIFAENLRNLLLQPPLYGRVLGVDPAYRTGCKLAVVDATGKLLQTQVIYPTPPQNRIAESKHTVLKMLADYSISLIAIGNGTASRETEAFIAECLKEYQDGSHNIAYVMVSEAGASVYSASKLAGTEFPKLDVSERSAISIARRLQDPLAELVKIDPKSIGVGQYQHDIASKKLDYHLGAVVESVVNQVGVDVNTASPSLLSYVAGLNQTVARNIVKYREENGAFPSRQSLKQVARLGERTLEQSAGFLRIHNGIEPLDATPIHPESYSIAKQLLSSMNLESLFSHPEQRRQALEQLKSIPLEDLSARLGVGEPTMRDILAALEKPGRDPREDAASPVLRKDVLKIEDLKPGMELMGTVRNVVDFGAFVDIGVKNDGLVHISQMADRYVKHPMEIVAVGDTLRVRVIDVDVNKGRIGLSLKQQ
ncbi:RNA-binding transcriptional accessory protein [Alicyclobacillus sp. SO9]|nr:RNA-binding transcriptional accessory protein [Alicyclobacillus sp. SO9]